MILRAALLLAMLAGGAAAQNVTYGDVAPIFAGRCIMCHSGEFAPLGLVLESYEAVLSGSENGPVVRAGDVDSEMLMRLRGEATPQMPLDGPPFLDLAEITLLTDWVLAGMPQGSGPLPEPVAPRPVPQPGDPVLWPDVQPIFLRSCIECHSDNSKLDGPPEGLRLDTLENLRAGGDRLAVVPGNPAASEIWRRVTGLAQPRMPFDGPPWLTEDEIRLVRDWIAQGAPDAEDAAMAMPVGGNVRYRGNMTGMAEIDGVQFVIGPATRIEDRPAIGQRAEMRGEVQADGSILATRLRDR